MDREKEMNEQQDGNKFWYFAIFSLIVMVIIACTMFGIMLHSLLVNDSDGAEKNSDWKVVREETKRIDDVNFNYTWRNGNQALIDVENGTMTKQVGGIHYFVSTDKPSYYEVKVYEEVQNNPVWYYKWMNPDPKLRSVHVMYINDKDTKEVSKRFAHELGNSLMFIKEQDFKDDMKEYYESLPHDFDIKNDELF